MGPTVPQVEEPSPDRRDRTRPWRDTPVHRRLWWWLLEHGQWLLLALLGGTAFLLWEHVRHQSEIPAYAMAREHAVGSPQRGVLAELAVHEGQRVKKGQVLARLDARLLEADLAEARVKAEELEAHLASAAVLFRQRQVGLAARLGALESDAREGLVTSWSARQRWQAELRELEHELTRQTRIREGNLGPTNRLGELLARREALKQRIAAAPLHAGLYRAKAEQARKLRTQLQPDGSAPTADLQATLKPIRAQLKIQRLRIERLAFQRDQLTLRSPADGVVKDVGKRQGDPLDTATTILTVVEERPRYVVAYVRDTAIRQVRVGMRVKVSAKAMGEGLLGLFAEKKEFQGKVIGVGVVTILPGRFRDYIRRPIWSVPVTIEVAGSPHLIPGERMHVTFEEHVD